MGFNPSRDMSESVAKSSLEHSTEIVVEASSIRSHYAGLNLSAVEGESLPMITGPLRAPLAIQKFPIAKLAMSKLLKRIQRPRIITSTRFSLRFHPKPLSAQYAKCGRMPLWTLAGIFLFPGKMLKFPEGYSNFQNGTRISRTIPEYPELVPEFP